MQPFRLEISSDLVHPIENEVDQLESPKHRIIFTDIIRHLKKNYQFNVFIDQIDKTEICIYYLADGVQLVLAALFSARNNLINPSSIILRTLEERMYESRLVIQRDDSYKYWNICFSRDQYYYSNSTSERKEAFENTKRLVYEYCPNLRSKIINIESFESLFANNKLKRIKDKSTNWYQAYDIRSHTKLVLKVLDHIDRNPKTKKRSQEYLSYSPTFRDYLNRCTHSGLVNINSIAQYTQTGIQLYASNWEQIRLETFYDALIIHLCGLIRNALWYAGSKKLDDELLETLFKCDLFTRCLRDRGIIK